MNYEDFIRHFSAVNVCKTKSMNEIRLKGKYVRMYEENTPTDQVVSKWFYYLEVHKRTHVSIFSINDYRFYLEYTR